MLIILLSVIVILSYAVLHILTISSFGARVAGRISKRPALGTTLSITAFSLSRFIVLVFLPSLAFLVENGITINNYLILALSSYILTFILSSIMLIKLNNVQRFFQTVFIKYNESTFPIALLKSLSFKKTDLNLKNCESFTFDKVIPKKTSVSFLAYIFLITGFFNAFMLAVLFPENRLTLSQFTAIFHGFGAIIFAFYLDPMLSRSIDNVTDNVSWLKNVYSILVGRVLSYFAMIIILLIFIIILNLYE